jgi:hypothetical protein
VVGRVSCVVLEENLVIPTQATKHNVHPQRLLQTLKRLVTGNTGLALGLRHRQRPTTSLDTALEVRGVVLLLQLWVVVAV